MSGAVPAEEALVLYNELVSLSPADEEAVARIAARLDQIRRTQPGNLNVRMALLKAYCLLGKAGFANDLANGLWNVRHSLASAVARNYALMIYDLGMYEKFLEFTEDPFSNPPPQKNSLANLWFNAFWRLGRLDDIRKYGGRFRSTRENHQDVERLFSELEGRKLTAHFAAHQHIIREETDRLQICASITAVCDEEVDNSSEIEFATLIYVNEAYKERISREDVIRHRLETYYARFGLQGSGYWHLMPVILQSHKAISFDTESRAAA